MMKAFKHIVFGIILTIPFTAIADEQSARDLYYSPTKALFASGNSATTIASNQRVGENFTTADNENLGGIANYYEKLDNLGVTYKIELLRPGTNTPKVVNSSHIFKSGDRIRVHVSSNADGYMHTLHKGSSGNVMLIPVSTGGRVINGQTITIPSESGWLVFDDQKGIEKLDLVFASAPQASSTGIIPGPENTDSLISNIQQVALKYSNSKDLVVYENSGEQDLMVEHEVNALTPVVVNRTNRPASQIEQVIYNAPATYAVNTSGDPVAVKINLKHQ